MKITDEVLAERNKTYGPFIVDAAMCQDLKDVVHLGPNWGFLDPDQKQALEMICVKMARILCGDPHFKDSWLDISGYAVLVLRRLEEDAEHPVEALPFSGVLPRPLHNSEDQSTQSSVSSQ